MSMPEEAKPSMGFEVTASAEIRRRVPISYVFMEPEVSDGINLLHGRAVQDHHDLALLFGPAGQQGVHRKITRLVPIPNPRENELFPISLEDLMNLKKTLAQDVPQLAIVGIGTAVGFEEDAYEALAFCDMYYAGGSKLLQTKDVNRQGYRVESQQYDIGKIYVRGPKGLMTVPSPNIWVGNEFSVTPLVPVSRLDERIAGRL